MPSSVIRAFHYHHREKLLDITFVSGRKYRYLEVPESLHAAFRAAFSKGEFFNRHIRERFTFVVLPKGDQRLVLGGNHRS